MEAEVRHLILATAGHVDHGKSSLVKALTGEDPDRLPEEKARRITIDLGFAHLTLPPEAAGAPGTTDVIYSVGMVDVPGHEDFVKNMVAGVGSVDLAMLMVAADDGWMPQTEEHLQILTYLGVRHGVVVLTKADLLDGAEEEQRRRREIRDCLKQSPLADAPLISTSVTEGRGLKELSGALRCVMDSMNPAADFGKPRLPVDRVFQLQGIGTVATGTLTGGCLAVGQEVVLQPLGKAARVRNLQNHRQDMTRCEPGTRVAVNLPDATPGKDIKRGTVVAGLGLGEPSQLLHVWLEKSPRLAGREGPAARPLAQGVPVQVHHGSAHVPARARWPDPGALAPGESRVAQLRLEAPLTAMVGDRFIVRDWSERHTLAGGVILETTMNRQTLRDAARLEQLRRRAQGMDDVLTMVGTELALRRWVRKSRLMENVSGWSRNDLTCAAEQLAGRGEAVMVGDRIADGKWWRELAASVREKVEAAHRRHPERPGIEMSEVRRELEPDMPDKDAWSCMLEYLLEREFRQSGTTLALASHRQALPGPMQEAGRQLREALGKQPFEPPTKRELLATPQAESALRFLLDTGEAVMLSDDTVLSAEAYSQAAAQIARYLRFQKAATASELRQLLKTSRRVIIPLLERMDQEGITMRQGNQRVLKQAARGRGPTGVP